MSKKILAMFMATAMAATTFFGCGSTEEASKKDEGSSTTSTDEDASTKTDDEKVTLEVAVSGSAQEIAIHQQKFDLYMKEHPNVTIKPVDIGSERFQKLMTLIGADNAPDIIYLNEWTYVIFMWIFVFCMLFNGGTVPWYITMKNYNLMDNIFGLVLGTGLQVFNVILAVNFFKNLPVELEEACFVDGGGPWRNLISIYVPLAKPMVATVALFTMVMYWNEFFQGMVLSTRQSSYPLQTYIQQMVVTLDYSTMNVDQIAQAMKLNNLSLDSAKIFIAMIPVLIVYPFLQRYFVEGITLGSVKG